MDQLEGSFGLLLPDFISLISCLSDTSDETALLNQINSFVARLKSLEASVEQLPGAELTHTQQLELYQTLRNDLLKRGKLLQSYKDIPALSMCENPEN